MSTVDNIGRYKISNFENRLIEMFEKETNREYKEKIALNLFQLGTLKSITALKTGSVTSSSHDLRKFCSDLLKKYEEYEKIRSEYYNGLVVSILETK